MLVSSQNLQLGKENLKQPFMEEIFHLTNYGDEAITILKIENVYKKGRKYYPQAFVKEFKIRELNTSVKLFLDGLRHVLHFRVKTTN